MTGKSLGRIAAAACVMMLSALPALAQNVKVTPLGGQEGEFCPQDRAMIFEHPWQAHNSAHLLSSCLM